MDANLLMPLFTPLGAALAHADEPIRNLQERDGAGAGRRG